LSYVHSFGENKNASEMGRTDFNQMLLESLNESISTVIDRRITPELASHLEAYTRISLNEVPDQINLIFTSLLGSFGLRGDALCRMVVEKMYRKAGVPFYEIGGQPMIQYIYELKIELAETF